MDVHVHNHNNLVTHKDTPMECAENPQQEKLSKLSSSQFLLDYLLSPSENCWL